MLLRPFLKTPQALKPSGGCEERCQAGKTPFDPSWGVILSTPSLSCSSEWLGSEGGSSARGTDQSSSQEGIPQNSNCCSGVSAPSAVSLCLVNTWCLAMIDAECGLWPLCAPLGASLYPTH